MKFDDKQLSAAILTAISELPEPGIAEVFMDGGKLEVNYETGQAQLWPGMQMEAHPLPEVEVVRSKSRYLISSVSMWIPPFPGAQLAHQKVLTLRGWDTLFAWARQVLVKSSEIWVHHLRDIEEGAISGLDSRIMGPTAGISPEQSRSGA